VILGWLPLAVGIGVTIWLIALQMELSAVALLFLFLTLALAHALDPPIPEGASLESLRASGSLGLMGIRLGIELLAVVAVLTLSRHLRDRDERELLQWNDADALRRLAEFFDEVENSEGGVDDHHRRLLALGSELIGLEVGGISRTLDGCFELMKLYVSDGVDGDGDDREPLDAGVGFVTEIEKTLCHRTLTRDRALGIEDVGDWGRGALPWRAYLGIPIRVAGQSYGTLFFASREPRARRFRGIEKHWLGLMSGWLGRDLDRRGEETRGDVGRRAEPVDENQGPVPVESIDRPLSRTDPAPAPPASLPRPRNLLTPRTLDVNRAVHRLEKRLRAELGPNHSLELDLDPGVPEVRVPRTLFVQVLFGLIANGLETLPDGGVITIESGHLEAESAEHPMRRYATLILSCDTIDLDGSELINRMEEAPAARADKLTFQYLRGLLTRVDGDHSVHCEPGGRVVLTAYLPAAEEGTAAMPG
jgi:hypothetical protein